MFMFVYSSRPSDLVEERFNAKVVANLEFTKGMWRTYLVDVDPEDYVKHPSKRMKAYRLGEDNEITELKGRDFADIFITGECQRSKIEAEVQDLQAHANYWDSLTNAAQRRYDALASQEKIIGIQVEREKEKWEQEQKLSYEITALNQKTIEMLNKIKDSVKEEEDNLKSIRAKNRKANKDLKDLKAQLEKQASALSSTVDKCKKVEQEVEELESRKISNIHYKLTTFINKIFRK